jgi:hypothetical protein
MEIIRQFKKDPYLHSPNHVLADELANKLNDKKHFALYLGMAKSHNHDFLRGVAGQVLEGKAKKPGALFAYLVKKNKEENSNA